MTGMMGRPMEFATPETLQGGLLAVTVDLTLRASHENAATVADRFRALAEQCAARAQECRDYSLAMDEYDRRYADYQEALVLSRSQAGDIPRPIPPSRPAAPPTYVERS